jgi:hypothetical protein
MIEASALPVAWSMRFGGSTIGIFGLDAITFADVYFSTFDYSEA